MRRPGARRRGLTRSAGAALLVLVALLLAGGPREAAAYVRARDAVTGEPLRWAGGEIVFTLSATHGSPELSSATLADALRRAGARWTTEVGCTGLTFRVAPPSPRAARARRDGVNAVLVHDRHWCRDGVPERLSCYDREEEAMTTTYVARDATSGEVTVVEADLELNAVHYRWARAGAAADQADEALVELLVHELGHVLGLAHGCDDGELPPGAVDERGRRPPRCPEHPPAVVPAMFPLAPAASARLKLAPDERRAVCELYPLRAPTAGRAGGCACRAAAAAPGSTPTGLVTGVLGVLALGWRFRCRRRRREDHRTRARARARLATSGARGSVWGWGVGAWAGRGSGEGMGRRHGDGAHPTPPPIPLRAVGPVATRVPAPASLGTRLDGG